MKDYPTREKFAFIVCDDIRPEQNNKLSLMGWFPDTVVLIPDAAPSQPTFALASLACAIGVLDGQGVFVGTMEIRGPDGKLVIRRAPTDSFRVEKLPGRPMTLNVKLAPFTGPFGTYALVLKLDGKPYEFSFTVKRQPAQA